MTWTWMLSAALAADVTVPVQGVWTEGDGGAPTGSRALTFRLWDTQTSALLFDEDVVAELVEGRFSVRLGTQPADPLDDAVFSAPSLALTVGPTGGEASGPVAVDFAPRAAWAANAGAVQGQSLDQLDDRYLRADAPMITLTGAPSAPGDVVTVTYLETVLGDYLEASGGSLATLTLTGTPSAPTDAATKAYVDGLGRVTSVGATGGLTGGPITSSGSLSLATDAASLAKVSGGLMTSTGTRIGIGTSEPATALHNVGSSTLGGAVTLTGGWRSLRLEGTGDDPHRYDFISGPIGGNAAGSDGIVGNNAGEGGFAILDANGDHYRLSIDRTGKVGIGTHTPTETLHVQGTLRTTGGLINRPIGLVVASQQALVSAPNGANTKIPYAIEHVDLDGWFSGGNYTPQRAGYYRINAHAYVYPAPASGGQYVALRLFRNGAGERVLSAWTTGPNIDWNTPGGSAIVYANGTTDSFSVHLYHTFGTTPAVQVSEFTFFEAEYLGAP
jgi:hypothetical protein